MPERSPAAFIDVLGRGGSPDPNEYGYRDSDAMKMMNAFFMNDQSVIDKYAAFMKKRERERLLREKQMKEAQGMAAGAQANRKKNGVPVAPTPKPAAPSQPGDLGRGIKEVKKKKTRQEEIEDMERELGLREPKPVE